VLWSTLESTGLNPCGFEFLGGDLVGRVEFKLRQREID